MKGIKQINNYKFIYEIGKGSASNVYLAVNEKTNELFAIKQISFEKITEKSSMENFKRELKLLNSFNNENIIKILGIEKTKNNIYLVLEYCNGGNLMEYKKYYEYHYKKQMNELYIQKILKQIINGLEYMHHKKIVHRDIKLDNIVINFSKFPKKLKDKNEIISPIKLEQTSLDDDFQIKIADLGYAKDLSIDLTASTFCGTPITMAPETMENQFNENKYNTKADLWSLGAITYELLIGHPPFYENNIKGLMNKIKNGTYTLPKNKKISLEIISFINGLLQFNPDKRMNWEQIKKHPFITKKVEEFNYLNLETINDDNKKDIEININNLDNYLWLNFKKNENLDLDKIDENFMNEPKIKKIIEENKIENKEILEIIDKEINKEKEKFQIKENEMKKKLENLEKQKNELKDENLKLKNESLKFKKDAELNQKKFEEQKKILDNELKNNIESKLKRDLQNKYFDLDEINIQLEQYNEDDRNEILEEKKKIEKEIKLLKNQIKKYEKYKKFENEFELIENDNEWEEIEDDEVQNEKEDEFEKIE
jgi:serine/threonine-protein kinase ULK/ATG1